MSDSRMYTYNEGRIIAAVAVHLNLLTAMLTASGALDRKIYIEALRNMDRDENDEVIRMIAGGLVDSLEGRKPKLPNFTVIEGGKSEEES